MANTSVHIVACCSHHFNSDIHVLNVDMICSHIFKCVYENKTVSLMAAGLSRQNAAFCQGFIAVKNE